MNGININNPSYLTIENKTAILNDKIMIKGWVEQSDLSIKDVFSIYNKVPIKGYILTGESHPPKKRIVPNEHSNKMFAYSPNQNIAYIIPEYSVW